MEGDGWKGMEGEWSRQTCQLHITPAFKTFSSGKVIIRRIKLNIRRVKNFGGAKALRPDLQGVGRSYKIIGGRSSHGASQGRIRVCLFDRISICRYNVLANVRESS